MHAICPGLLERRAMKLKKTVARKKDGEVKYIKTCWEGGGE